MDDLRIHNGDLMVLWTQLGEGYRGEYNPDDPEDKELLRFDVLHLVDGEWESYQDESYCTNFWVDAPLELRIAGLAYIFTEVYVATQRGKDVSRVCEALSWIDHGFIEDWLNDCVLRPNAIKV